LQSIGYEAKNYSYSTHPFGYHTDYLIYQIDSNNLPILLKKIKMGFFITYFNIILRVFFLLKMIILIDTFIFIDLKTIFRNGKDLDLLKLFNKKIVFVFLGCGERDPEFDINKNIGGPCNICTDIPKQEKSLCNQREEKRSLIQYFEEKADFLFADYDLFGFLKHPEKAHPIYVPVEDTRKKNLMNKFVNGKIRIVHFPSNPLLKGTKQVLTIIDDFKKKYPEKIEFYYPKERISNETVLRELEQSHILLDEFNLFHGVLAVEALARNVIVICRIDKQFLELRPTLPIVNTELKDLKKTLSELIMDIDKMKDIAESGNNYYQKFHSYDSVGNYFAEIIFKH